MTDTGTYDGADGRWDDSFDVVVVGYGYAGAIAAIEASDAGSSVLLLEKMPDPGGISICSGGNVRTADDADEALAYLKETAAGTTPDDVLAVLAQGMTEVPAYFERLAKASGARVARREAPGNYPFPGIDTFAYYYIDSVPEFDPAARYPHVNSYLPIHRAAGVRLFKVMEDNIEQRDIAVWLESPARRLLTGTDGAVQGVIADTPSGTRRIQARQGVVLASGGFEANQEMQRQWWQEKPVLTAAFLGSTGDGIRMAQAVGADLWHMWLFHGTYGFRHPDPDYPYGIRMKRLPDWVPGRAPRADVKMPWIVVDQNGRRYMNEYPPYLQDTSHRSMATYDPQTQRYPRIPSWIVLDDEGRGTYPLCSPTFNDRGLSFEYTPENLRALEDRIVRQAGTVGEVARAIGADLRGARIHRLALERTGCGRRGRRPRPPSSVDASHQDAAVSLRAGLADLLEHPRRPGARCEAAGHRRVRRAHPEAVRGGRAGRGLRPPVPCGRQHGGVLHRGVDRGPRGRIARTMGMIRETRRR